MANPPNLRKIRPGAMVTSEHYNALIDAINENSVTSVIGGMEIQKGPGGTGLSSKLPSGEDQVFLATPGDGAANLEKVVVGFLRDAVNDYQGKDKINVYDAESQDFISIDKSSAAESVTATDAGFTFYRVKRDAAGTWTATLDWLAAGSFPPSPNDYEELIVVVASNEWDATDGFVTTVNQILFGNPYLWPRPILPDFGPVYIFDTNEKVRILAGHIYSLHGNGAVASSDILLTVDTDVWVKGAADSAAGTFVVNGAIQTGTYPGFKVVTGSDTFDVNIKLGSVVSGKYQMDYMGSVILSQLFDTADLQDLWETINADSGSTTADSPTDTLTIAGSGSVSTAIVGDTLTITGIGAADQNLWLTISSDSGSVAANTTTDTLTIAGGAIVDTSISGDTVTIAFDHTEITGYSGSGTKVLAIVGGALQFISTSEC